MPKYEGIAKPADGNETEEELDGVSRKDHLDFIKYQVHLIRKKAVRGERAEVKAIREGDEDAQKNARDDKEYYKMIYQGLDKHAQALKKLSALKKQEANDPDNNEHDKWLEALAAYRATKKNLKDNDIWSYAFKQDND